MVYARGTVFLNLDSERLLGLQGGEQTFRVQRRGDMRVFSTFISNK